MFLRQIFSQNRFDHTLSRWAGLTLMAVLLGAAPLAFEESSPDEIIQDSVSEVVTENLGNILKLKVSESFSYEIETEPDLEKMQLVFFESQFRPW